MIDDDGVACDAEFRIDAALHAHLGCPGDVRFTRPIGDLLSREGEGIVVTLALSEGTEPATGVANVGEVDVAVHQHG